MLNLDNYSNENLVKLYCKNYDNKDLQKKIEEVIINKNMNIVAKFAGKYYTSYCNNFQDLLQSGRVAIMYALRNYDVDKAKGTFINYVCYYLKKYMNIEDYMSRNLIVPKKYYDKVSKLKNTRDKLMFKLGRNVTPHELAQEMNMTNKEIDLLLILERCVFSLNVGSSDEEDEDLNFLNLLCYENDNGILKNIEEKEFIECLDNLLKQILTDREYFIFKHIKFLEYTSQKTVTALIANGFGEISRQRVDQICQVALSKVLTSDKFSQFLISRDIFLSDSMKKEIAKVVNDSEMKKAKKTLNERRSKVRRNFQCCGECVNILDYYQCSEEQFLEVLSELKEEDRKKYIQAIGNIGSESYSDFLINPIVLKQPDIKSVDVRINTLLNNIIMNNSYNENATVKVLK